METLKVNITKEVRKNITVYRATTVRGKVYLMTFTRDTVSGDMWMFNLPENNERCLTYISEQFPTDYFLDVCRSLLVVRYGWTDIKLELTVASKNLLKIK